MISIIIPSFNGETRLHGCLDALRNQSTSREFEVLIVDDGSTDRTGEIAANYANVRVLSQSNQGPAAARNNGANAASGEILLFTDDDCVPSSVWVEEMARPFDDERVSGVRGAYGTMQSAVVARLIQVEYDDRYRRMSRLASVDYIGGYSAGYRRSVFLAAGGFAAVFTRASSEDGDLSYRLADQGHTLLFNPRAVVYHHHPDTLRWYWRRKLKYAYWRMLAFKRTPAKAVSDSHTPQMMKLQSLTLPLLLIGLVMDRLGGWSYFSLALLIGLLFLISVLPLALSAARRDARLALLIPVAFFGRSVAHFIGVVAGGTRFFIWPNIAKMLRP